MSESALDGREAKCFEELTKLTNKRFGRQGEGKVVLRRFDRSTNRFLHKVI